jgi:hypothetical protein
MARVAKSAKAIQAFRGGLNDLSKNPWLQQIGNGCCEVAPAIDQDRLNATIHSENALVHTRPMGHRDHWQFSEQDDTTRRQQVAHINANGVGSIIEIIVIPTFGFLQSVNVVALAEETGLEFEVVTRNGTVLPSGQLIKVKETDAGSGCGDVARVQSAGSLAAVGLLDGATRVYNIAVADQGGHFALEADVIQLKVKSLPADGVLGRFDLRVHITYFAVGRSEAAR